MALDICVLDFETTGMIQEGGRALELAAVMLNSETLLPAPDHAEFQVFIKPDPCAVWFDDAIATHGYTEEFINNVGVSEQEAGQRFLHWLESKHKIKTWLTSPGWWADAHHTRRAQLRLLGHNVGFDKEFFKQLFGSGMEIFSYKFLDTMQAAEFIQAAHMWDLGFHAQPFVDPEKGFPSVSLVSLAHAFGIDISGAHGALADSRMCAQVWRYMVKTLSEDLAASRKLQTYVAMNTRGVNE